MDHLLVDTDILIDIAHDDKIAHKHLTATSQTHTLCISAITMMELVIGCRDKSEQQALHKFLEQFRIYSLTEEISIQAMELIQTYALSHGLRIPDALIAATAISNHVALLSKNQRDYRFIANLNLSRYP
jgi:hypothetical protein